jgi:hypothetical protein
MLNVQNVLLKKNMEIMEENKNLHEKIFQMQKDQASEI